MKAYVKITILKNDNTFCLNVTKSHLCTLVKVFCIFHLNRKSELQTLCGYRYEIMRYKLSFKVIFLQEGRDILLEKITDAIKEGRFLKENTTS